MSDRDARPQADQPEPAQPEPAQPQTAQTEPASAESLAPVAVHATAAPPYTVKDGVVEVEDDNDEDGAVDPRSMSPATWMHQRLVHQILEFEKNLGPDHEIGGRFVPGPNSEPLHISNVASWAPDMILFVGQYPDGRRFELIQHYSQVSVLLVALPKMTEEPRRIGFELMKNFRDMPVTSWGDPIR